MADVVHLGRLHIAGSCLNKDLAGIPVILTFKTFACRLVLGKCLIWLVPALDIVHPFLHFGRHSVT